MKIEYPKFLYHKSAKPMIVQSQEEHEEVGSDWAEVPFPADDLIQVAKGPLNHYQEQSLAIEEQKANSPLAPKKEVKVSKKK